MEEKAAIYCRLSTEDVNLREDENSESILNQKLLLTDYAAAHRLSVYCLYVDDNYSGLDNRRPAFCRLLEDARHGRFQVILCKNQSRFTRDMETAERYLNCLFPLWGIRFIGVCDGADSEDRKNRKLRQINGLVNEWYCEDLSDNIRMILREKMQSGQFIGSFASYGYTKDPADPHRLIPDPPAAAVIRRIFEACLSGLSLRRIAELLNRENILPPCAYKTQQGLLFQTPFSGFHSTGESPRWSSSSVRRILTNPIYIGVLIQGKEKKENFKSSRRIPCPPQQWAVKEHAHPPLISEDAFFQAQLALASRRKRHSNPAQKKGKESVTNSTLHT